MKQMLILLGLVFTAVTVRADLVIELNFGGPKLKFIVKIKEDKIRYDISTDGHISSSRIADLKTGDDFNLDPMPKRIIKNPSILSYQTNAVAKPHWPIFRDTGKTETVNGYEAEIYNGTNANGAIETLWVAKDFP